MSTESVSILTPEFLTIPRKPGAPISGTTIARDPLDSLDGKEIGYGHGFMDVATDLHEIISTISNSKLGLTEVDIKNGRLHLLLIGASIGVPVVRLYAQWYPGIVAAAILLDSNIANGNYSDIWPNPDSPIFDGQSVISADCTLGQYKDARKKLTAMFDLSVKNPESLDRRNGPILLPIADAPKLVGIDAKGPFLTVVGHDPETFAEMSFKMMGTPKSLSEKLTNPYWAEYNEGLTKITDPGRCEGVVIASGCGHFIQKDDPTFVAKEIERSTV